MIDQKLMLPIDTVLHSETYRVVRYIASGGFGNTYEVEHVKLGKRYCLKEFFMRGINLRQGNTVTVSVENNRATFEQMRAKFFKEAQRMARIENPHVVEVTDCFEENATAYYVMKLIDGQSLAAKMAAQGRPFTEAEVLSMLPQVLSALHCVHAQGIYHLDLKPANIMANAEGHLWLIDFGASKQLSATENQTLSTSTGLCYTPNYAPSELVSGNTKRIGPWTDYYSLGATLYNLLTNYQPPEADDVRYDGEHAFQFPATFSADMRSLILWLMHPDYPQRPQTVEEIEHRLTDAFKADKEATELVTPEKEETVITDSGTETVKSDEGAETVKAEKKPVKDAQSEKSKKKGKAIIAAVVVAILLPIAFYTLRKDRVDETVVKVDETAVYRDNIHFYDIDCPDSNHPHTIDLGLPSGTMWACCNVGAGSPTDYGDYYAWGETESKTTYNWNTYRYGSSKDDVQHIGSDIAGTQYDVAHVRWRSLWRMPSKMQIQELLDNTNSEWTIVNGVEGRRFTSKTNGNSVFLPAAGRRWSGEFSYVGSWGYYWSSTPGDGSRGYSLYFNSDYASWGINGRYFGQSVRPVR